MPFPYGEAPGAAVRETQIGGMHDVVAPIIQSFTVGLLSTTIVAGMIFLCLRGEQWLYFSLVMLIISGLLFSIIHALITYKLKEKMTRKFDVGFIAAFLFTQCTGVGLWGLAQWFGKEAYWIAPMIGLIVIFIMTFVRFAQEQIFASPFIEEHFAAAFGDNIRVQGGYAPNHKELRPPQWMERPKP